MKPLKDQKFWKILSALIILIAIGAVLYTDHLAELDRKADYENNAAFNEAKAAGYDEEYWLCSLEEPITLEGITYERYLMIKQSYLGVGDVREILLTPGAEYIDESEGKTSDLVIYAKTADFVNDPDDPVTYDQGKYRVVDPYKIAEYQKKTSVFAAVYFSLLATTLEIILSLVLVIYFISYFVKKRKSRDQKA